MIETKLSKLRCTTVYAIMEKLVAGNWVRSSEKSQFSVASWESSAEAKLWIILLMNRCMIKFFPRLGLLFSDLAIKYFDDSKTTCNQAEAAIIQRWLEEMWNNYETIGLLLITLLIKQHILGNVSSNSWWAGLGVDIIRSIESIRWTCIRRWRLASP